MYDKVLQIMACEHRFSMDSSRPLLFTMEVVCSFVGNSDRQDHLGYSGGEVSPKKKKKKKRKKTRAHHQNLQDRAKMI
jgi:hypothetical protein